jgi:hypothetical protein
MIEGGEFGMQVRVRVSSELAETEISMALRADPTVHDFYPISGFPRKLQGDYEGDHPCLAVGRALLTLFL